MLYHTYVGIIMKISSPLHKLFWKHGMDKVKVASFTVNSKLRILSKSHIFDRTSPVNVLAQQKYFIHKNKSET